MRKQRVGGFRWRILGLLLAMVLLVACGGQTGSNPPVGAVGLVVAVVEEEVVVGAAWWPL